MHRPLLAALGLAVVASPLSAQGWIELERPRVALQNPASITRVSSQVHTTIDGRVARVEVEEQFRNTGGAIAEGSYLYPMPGEAVFQNFSLWMGEREINGEMMNADQARGVYEEIVRRLKDPALLTLAGHGLVRAQVFPIQPGETRKVALRYTALLDRSGDALRLRYAVGERGGASPSFQVDLADPSAYGVPYSPTSRVSTTRVGGQLHITIQTDGPGDVELFLPLRRGLVGTTVLTHAPGGEDGYFMLLLAPPTDEQGPVVPRDVSFVVDVSGSMSGGKMDQARAALLQALETLRPEDRFRLVAFSSAVRPFRDGFTPATRGNIHAARDFINGLQADGGTNIAGALDAVLGSAVAEDRLPIVVFLTDGVPSVGEQEPDRIAAMAAGKIGRARIFTVGVGHDVNTYLLDRLAREGRGSAEYVASDASVETAVGSLLGKIRRPALVDLRIVDSPVRLLQNSPGVLPDLFYGEELVVFGRYHDAGRGSITIEGERNGHRERFTTDALFPSNEQGNEFISKLWASRRIGDLTRQIRLEGSTESLIKEVRDLGLRHGILTEYTSYLVQEPGDLATGQPRRGRDDVRPMYDAVPAAAAPAAQTGSLAFERARESSRLSQANTLAEADQAVEGKMAALGSAENETKRAGGRIFLLRSGVWTDAAHTDSLRIVEVAPYSDAYFALARSLPELAASLTVGDEVVIAGRKLSIRLTSHGTKTWQTGELLQVVRGFRGAA